jgi:hypothetical protein
LCDRLSAGLIDLPDASLSEVMNFGLNYFEL